MKNLNLCLGLLLCLVGIEYSYGMLSNWREVQNHCRAEGGYCINTIPPQPPRPKKRPQRRRMGRRRGMPRTRTRKGSRMTGGARAGARRPGAQGGAAAGPPPYQAPPAQNTWTQQGQGQQAWNQPPPQQQQHQQQQSGGFDFFSNPMSWMFFQTRKKRQAAQPEPFEPGEAPQIQPGQSVMSFLNQNCRKAEPDFACMQQGGWCCRPPL